MQPFLPSLTCVELVPRVGSLFHRVAVSLPHFFFGVPILRAHILVAPSPKWFASTCLALMYHWHFFPIPSVSRFVLPTPRRTFFAPRVRRGVRSEPQDGDLGPAPVADLLAQLEVRMEEQVAAYLVRMREVGRPCWSRRVAGGYVVGEIRSRSYYSHYNRRLCLLCCST